MTKEEELDLMFPTVSPSTKEYFKYQYGESNDNIEVINEINRLKEENLKLKELILFLWQQN